MNAFYLVIAVTVCLLPEAWAGDCSCTAYADGDGDTDCSKLKEYISCAFKADSVTACDIPSADLDELKKAKCTANLGVCKCEADYYTSDLTTKDDTCKALDAFEKCLNDTTTGDLCKDETKANLTAFVTKRKGDKGCSTASAGGDGGSADVKTTEKPASAGGNGGSADVKTTKQPASAGGDGGSADVKTTKQPAKPTTTTAGSTETTPSGANGNHVSPATGLVLTAVLVKLTVSLL